MAGTGGTGGSGGGTGGGSYFAEWRGTVNRELERTAELHAQASVTFERIKGQLDEHDRRLTSLETSPASLRSSLGIYGGCVSQIIGAAFIGFNSLVAVAALIVAFVHRP